MGLYRRKDSPFWWMSFSANGKPFRRPTGTKDRKKAEKILAKIQTQITEDKWFEVEHTFTCQKFASRVVQGSEGS